MFGVSVCRTVGVSRHGERPRLSKIFKPNVQTLLCFNDLTCPRMCLVAVWPANMTTPWKYSGQSVPRGKPPIRGRQRPCSAPRTLHAITIRNVQPRKNTCCTVRRRFKMVSGTPLRFRPPPTPSEGTVEASLPRPLLRAMLFLSSLSQSASPTRRRRLRRST